MPDPNRERVAQNFVKRYGKHGLQRLLQALEQNESGQVIADEFAVSRERVRQWKNAFGQVRTQYDVHPDVAGFLGGSSKPKKK